MTCIHDKKNSGKCCILSTNTSTDSTFSYTHIQREKEAEEI